MTCEWLKHAQNQQERPNRDLTSEEALARMPESLDAAEAAPLMCAGVTTFNSLRHSGALPSDLVAIQGIGGLGHLAVQFAKKFGYRVAAVGRGSDNATLAKKLSADAYIDSAAMDPCSRAAETWRRERDSCNRAERESDVGVGRRPRCERHNGGCGSVD
jgi:D-arabinose 1-dehydrogenase-like Zn-dependent alcohol dehydrogenase